MKQGAEPLAAVIRQHGAEIEQRWLERVTHDIAARPGLELTQLRDGIPDYLASLGDLLGSEQSGDFAERSNSAWVTVAREHGVTRVRIGFDITELIHEFVVLRQIIRQVAMEQGVLPQESDSVLSDIFDAAISAAVKAYVEARDYQTGRRQAETIAFFTHELRNPLSAATMAARQLRRHASSEQRPLLDLLDRSHERMRDLIDGVLYTEKLEAGAEEPSFESVRLGDLMEGSLDAARTLAAEKGLTFEVQYDPAAVVRVDHRLARSAIQNLAENAAKYTDEGGVRISAEERGGRVVIDFFDTGPGIPPEDLGQLFEPFRRGATDKSGTGLGLAIARRAMEVQGGTIGAESHAGRGSHFWIELPGGGDRPEEAVSA